MDHTPAPAPGGRHRAEPGAVAATPRPATAASATAASSTAASSTAAPSATTVTATVTRTAAPGRCPSCASRVGPREEWCSLCHAALRPAVDPVLETPVEQEPPVEDEPPVAVAGEAGDEPALDPEVVDEMLAQLAGAAAGPALRGLASTQAKVLVAALGGLGLTGLLLLAMTVAGAVLG